ncbi:MAG: hypothetical protein LBR75_01385 [Prevotellaceae bacterium]|jgi:hypothetical protein|nr:hypothetical protein [Prevotellaceae bacterium]
MKKLRISAMLLIATLFLSSCGELMFREINCRSFEFQDDLKWYAGNVGDVITLSNQANETKEFIIEDKVIFHTKKYTSDTGCGCYDRWGMQLIGSKDTITMYSESVYIEKNAAESSNYFLITFNNVFSGYFDENRSIVSNYTIESNTFAQVLIFDYLPAANKQFNKIVIAPEIGVVQLIEANGNIWTNTDLNRKLNIDMNSFKYNENTCE